MRQHSDLQQLREARQIAKDFNLDTRERKVKELTRYLVYRKTFDRRVYLGFRSSVSGLRTFVERCAKH